MWVLGSVVAPTELELFDNDQSKAVDGYGGGVYAPNNRLVIGGAGVDFTGGTGADPNGPLTATAAAGTQASGIVATGDESGSGGVFTGGPGGGYGVTATGNNAPGVFALGNQAPGLMAIGTGPNQPGVSATGDGSTSGPGASFSGGAPNGNGVVGSAAGLGTGVQGTGLIGVLGQGIEAGVGVAGIGGPSGGNGVSGTGGSPSSGQGGSGLIGQGGTPNGAGVTGTGQGSAPGGIFTGGETGDGILAVGQGGAPGGSFTGGSLSDVAIYAANASVWVPTNVANSNESPLTHGTNRLWATNIPKAWMAVTLDGSGNFATSDAFNCTAETNGDEFIVSFVDNMADAHGNYDVGVQIDNPGSSPVVGFLPTISNKSPTGFTIQAIIVQSGPPAGGSVSGLINLDTFEAGATVSFRVFGRQ